MASFRSAVAPFVVASIPKRDLGGSLSKKVLRGACNSVKGFPAVQCANLASTSLLHLLFVVAALLGQIFINIRCILITLSLSQSLILVIVGFDAPAQRRR